MSLPEVVWRARYKARRVFDRLALPVRSKVLPVSRPAKGVGSAGLLRPGVFGDALPPPGMPDGSPMPYAWCRRTLVAADRIADNRLTIFDLGDHDLGPEINWNYEYKAKKPTPMGFAPGIDYRDQALTGDCKFVWELSRHHQLVTLARAFRLTGDAGYASTAWNQLLSWIRQCPYGTGMNWRSPLELAIRLINWVWTVELIRPSGVFDTQQAQVDQVVSGVYRHLRDISGKYSRFSSANNHLIGEAAGVFIGSSYFAGLSGASRWRARSREILSREIFEQTHTDGGNSEQAFGYHLFVLQFFLLAGLAARYGGDDFSPAYWDRLEKMFEFVAAFLEGGEAHCGGTMFGDCDDGYVLDLGGRLGDPRTLMAVGAVLFGRADFKALAGTFHDPAYWLFGEDGRRRFDAIDACDVVGRLGSRALPDSGYYLLQSGRRGQRDAVSVVFDCGELGFKSIAAHGHADALSFTLRVGGVDVLVDPGTYDYFSHPRWRDYFRRTRAHNTVEIDGVDQSETLGPFMWGRRASARCVRWEPSESGGTVVGEHDGYRRLDDPVTHRRTITLDGDPLEVKILDEIVAEACHDVALYFHLAEACRAKPIEGNTYELDYGCGTATIEFDASQAEVSVSAVTGGEDPILGWVSRGYHRKAPSTTLVVRVKSSGIQRLGTRIRLADSAAADRSASSELAAAR